MGEGSCDFFYPVQHVPRCTTNWGDVVQSDLQLPLICETYRDALQAVISALGGFKRVGATLWPTLPPDDAGRRLAHCLDPDKRAVLSPESLAMIRRMARQAGVHLLASFEMRDAGYGEPKPIEPEDERAALQREFVQHSKALQALATRLERAGVRFES